LGYRQIWFLRDTSFAFSDSGRPPGRRWRIFEGGTLVGWPVGQMTKKAMQSPLPYRGCIFPPVLFSPRQTVAGCIRIEGILLHPAAGAAGASLGRGERGRSRNEERGVWQLRRNIRQRKISELKNYCGLPRHSRRTLAILGSAIFTVKLVLGESMKAIKLITTLSLLLASRPLSSLTRRQKQPSKT